MVNRLVGPLNRTLTDGRFQLPSAPRPPEPEDEEDSDNSEAEKDPRDERGCLSADTAPESPTWQAGQPLD